MKPCDGCQRRREAIAKAIAEAKRRARIIYNRARGKTDGPE